MLEAVPREDAVADIGSDHGWVAAALAARGQRVIATERTQRMVDRLRREAEVSGWVFTVRQGEGMQPICEGEVETVVVAGLGGRSMVGIIGRAAWLPVRMVLQPMSHEDELVDWLGSHDWRFQATEVRDRGRAYRVYSATR